MDNKNSKKRKEKILKQLNKSTATEKKTTGQVDKLRDRINKEKSSYQKHRQAKPEKAGKTDAVGTAKKAVTGGTARIGAWFRKRYNKFRGMPSQARYRMIGAWVVGLAFLVIIVGIIFSSVRSSREKQKEQADDTTAQTQAEATTQAEDTNPLTACSNEAVTTLITNYITAMRDVNLDTMKSLDVYQDAYASDSNFRHTADVIEDYKDLTIYTKNGPYENGFTAYVVTNIKFKGIDKTCQGMLQYVVRLQEDGSYKIDTTPEDDIEDDDVVNAMTALSQSEDVLTLIDSVNQQCEADIAADENLKAYVEGTLQGAGGTATATTQAEATEATQAEETQADTTQAE